MSTHICEACGRRQFRTKAEHDAHVARYAFRVRIHAAAALAKVAVR